MPIHSIALLLQVEADDQQQALELARGAAEHLDDTFNDNGTLLEARAHAWPAGVQVAGVPVKLWNLMTLACVTHASAAQIKHAAANAECLSSSVFSYAAPPLDS